MQCKLHFTQFSCILHPYGARLTRGERISLCIDGIPRRSLYEGHGQETNAIIARHLEGPQSSQPMRKPEVTAAKKKRKVAEEVIKNSSIYARVACSDVQVINAAGKRLLEKLAAANPGCFLPRDHVVWSSN